MYRRPTLCTLHIAVDFLQSLKIAVVWGGGGGGATGIWCIYYIPVDDGRDQVLGLTTGIQYMSLYPSNPNPNPPTALLQNIQQECIKYII
jgi:hypothetical protein